jgi:hypothetical protein
MSQTHFIIKVVGNQWGGGQKLLKHENRHTVTRRKVVRSDATRIRNRRLEYIDVYL